MILESQIICIARLDRNDLYGYDMSESLPSGRFRWLVLEKFNLDKNDDNSLIGCVLEVNFEYPNELHKLHNHHLLAPDKL